MNIGPVTDSRSEPFFLFVNYMDAHTPCLPPLEYRRKFGSLRAPFSGSAGFRLLGDQVLSGNRIVSAEERDYLIASYDAGIAYVDDSLNRLFEVLRTLELFDSSLIMVTSDHGEMFGEEGIVGHGAGLFPQLLHVPLLVKYPNQRQAATGDETVSGVDLLPTVLAAVGVDATSSMDGRDLPSSTYSDEHPVFAESFESPSLPALNPRFRGHERAAFRGQVVYRITREGRKVTESWAVGARADTQEARLQERENLFHVLDRLALEAGRDVRSAPPPPPDVLLRLRALGYLGR